MKPKSPYNRTHLPMDYAEDRQIVHRDYLAHCLRWSHVLGCIEMGERVLDLGCADGPLAMALYSNKFKPELYLGCDIRRPMLEKAAAKLSKAPWARFLEVDLCKNFQLVKDEKPAPTVITSFEFIEHIPEDMVEPFLLNVKSLMGKETRFFLSTPCFDGKSKAANHVKEWSHDELKALLEKHFTIEGRYGTFMSQKDLKLAYDRFEPFSNKIMGHDEKAPDKPSLFDALRDYYDSNLLSILFAPLFPSYARNCIWRVILPC